jgi:hypothetical protein
LKLKLEKYSEEKFFQEYNLDDIFEKNKYLIMKIIKNVVSKEFFFFI